jgi:hypothetical protein
MDLIDIVFFALVGLICLLGVALTIAMPALSLMDYVGPADEPKQE